MSEGSMFADPCGPRFEFVDVEPRAGVVGEEVVVRWSALHADDVFVEDYGRFPSTGSVPVALDVTRSLRLMARGPAGAVAEAQTPVIRVFSPPVISFLRIPAPPSGIGTGIVSPAGAFEVRDEFAAVAARVPRGLPPSPGVQGPARQTVGSRRWLASARSGDFSAGGATGTAPAAGWGRAGLLLTQIGYPQFPSPPARLVRFRTASGGHGPDQGREGMWGRAVARLRRERLS